MGAPHVTIEVARKVRDLRQREKLSWSTLAERFGASVDVLRAAVGRADAVDAARPDSATRLEATAV